MAMTRVVLIGVVLLAAAGCSTKPSEESCEKAVNNIRKLTGQSNTDVGADKRAAVRSCRAQSSKDKVECMVEARTVEELDKCGGKFAAEVKKMMEEQKKEAAGSGAAPPAGGGGMPATPKGP
jgi:hypothetical protein